MKKMLLSLISLLLLNNEILAQSGTEDKEGNSSVFLPIGNLSINTTDARIKAYYSTGFPSAESYLRFKKYKNTTDNKDGLVLTSEDSLFFNSKYVNRFAFALGAEGSNADGLATIFSDGNITPESKLFVAFGSKFYFSKHNLFKKGRKIAENFEVSKDLKKNFTNNWKTTLKRINDLKTDFYQSVETNSKEAELRLDSLKKEYEKNKELKSEIELASNAVLFFKRIKNNIDSIEKYKDNNLIWPIALDTISKLAERNQNLNSKIKHTYNPNEFFKPQELNKLIQRNLVIADSLENQQKLLKETFILNYEIIEKGTKNFLLMFLSAERNYREFKLLQDSYTKLDERYKKQTFDGFSIRYNLNWHFCRNSILGLSAGYQVSDNYDSLDDFKIESTTIVTDSNRTDKTTKEIKGKSGKYYTYIQYPIMVDYIYSFSPDEEVFMINPYYRYNIVAANDNDLKNNGRFGLAMYAFKKEKSKFLFGLFTELTIPKKEDDKRNAYQRLQFGIITKLNLIPYSHDRYNPVN